MLVLTGKYTTVMAMAISYVSFNWLFLWDYTFYKSGYCGTPWMGMSEMAMAISYNWLLTYGIKYMIYKLMGMSTVSCGHGVFSELTGY